MPFVRACPHLAEIGACHFLESIAFKTTAKRTSSDILHACQAHGITTSSVFNREVLMYKVDTLRSSLSPAMELLAESMLQPAFSKDDLEEARQVIAFQRDEALAQPQVLVSEQLYAAAYGASSPLGRPEKCPEGRIGSVSSDVLRGYVRKHFSAPHMVLSGVGVDHAELVTLARKLFGGVPNNSSSSGASSISRPSPVGYTGGDVRSSPDWNAMPATVSAATAKTEFTHFMMAFPTVGWAHDDVVPVCVVDTLLGGGSSFSAGGPGKGMYSRLYREVLNAYGWVESANAFSAQLYDSGLVGIYGAAPPEHAGALVRIAASHLARLIDVPVKHGELARARNQLASSVLMNLETRGLLAEDIGRQVLSHGKRLDPSELVRRIQAVNADDVIRVMKSALAHPPAFAAVGDCSSLPDYATLASYFASARVGGAAAANNAQYYRMSAGQAAAAATRSTAAGHASQLLQQHHHHQHTVGPGNHSDGGHRSFSGSASAAADAAARAFLLSCSGGSVFPSPSCSPSSSGEVAVDGPLSAGAPR